MMCVWWNTEKLTLGEESESLMARVEKMAMFAKVDEGVG